MKFLVKWRYIWKRSSRLFHKLSHRQRQPTVTQAQGTLAPNGSSLTFVVAVGPYFNQTIPNAATTCRLGWCRGFEQIGIPYVLVSVTDLARRLPELPHPIVWISGSDYRFLAPANLAALKRQCHVVWVSTWFDGDAQFYRQNNLENNSWPEALNQKILTSEPSLVFTISPERSFEYYQGWIWHGVRLVSLPLACDTVLYRRDSVVRPEFAGVEMAFVGGYWPYKARQFDRYLKPYADRLKVYGYSPWPYAGYSGRLPEIEEPSLYRQARLSPTINEPHVETMGIDLNERVFKVLGSAGMTITDVTPAYREWFSEDELPVPGNLDEYHDMVHRALTDDDYNARQRQKGYAAVIARHTYAHRARTLLEYVGIDPNR
jgi:hypothetical protein